MKNSMYLLQLSYTIFQKRLFATDALVGLYDLIYQLTRENSRIWKRRQLFDILLSYIYAYFIFSFITWKI